MEKENKTARRTGDGWRPESECGLLRNAQESLSREPTLLEEEVRVGGSIHYRKTGAKGSQHLISIHFSVQSCPKQRSKELACSFLEARLAQSLWLQLLCILLTGDGQLTEPCFTWDQQKRQTDPLTDPS